MLTCCVCKPVPASACPSPCARNCKEVAGAVPTASDGLVQSATNTAGDCASAAAALSVMLADVQAFTAGNGSISGTAVLAAPKDATDGKVASL